MEDNNEEYRYNEDYCHVHEYEEYMQRLEDEYMRGLEYLKQLEKMYEQYLVYIHSLKSEYMYYHQLRQQQERVAEVLNPALNSYTGSYFSYDVLNVDEFAEAFSNSVSINKGSSDDEDGEDEGDKGVQEDHKEEFPKTALREIKILKKLRHENIIELKGTAISSGEAY
ncbi:Cyclin-dependent kinase C-3 [Bienertia sinuspersici]